MWDNYFFEKYILNVLKANKNNVESALSTISMKFPFIKSKDLKSIITFILVKQINRENIGGMWRKIGKEWMLGDDGTSYPWSGPDLPSSQDQNSLGPARNTYSTPGDVPDVPEGTGRKTRPIEDVEDMEKMQQLYDKLYKKYEKYIDNNEELNKILVEELISRGYGNKVLNLDLKE